MEIIVEKLSFVYPSGVQALNEIDLVINPGERVAIIGQNGAGKTTLVKHLNGLLKPSSGRVTIGQWDTQAFDTAKLAARVGYVFQNPDDQLFQTSVSAEVMFGPKNLGFETERVAIRAEKALKMVGLSELTAKHPFDLPPGQRKLVALASVLAMDTPIVVLDEPTTGQDYRSLDVIGNIVNWLSDQGRTIVTISHDIDFCAEHFDRTILMANGEILADGPARDVLAQEELLAKSFVEQPQLVRLAREIGLEETPLNVQEFIEYRFVGSARRAEDIS